MPDEKQPYLPKHVVATYSYGGYEGYLVTAGTAGFLLDERVPNLDADNVVLKFDDEGWVHDIALLTDAFACLPVDEAAGLPGVAALEDREALRRHFAEQVWAHLCELIPPIQAFVPTSEHALRVATANSLTGTALWILQAVKQHAIAERESRAMAAALPFPARPRYFEVECNGERELHLDGSVCCYWYLRPDNQKGQYCANCPKGPIPKGIEVLREHMLARQQGVAEHYVLYRSRRSRTVAADATVLLELPPKQSRAYASSPG